MIIAVLPNSVTPKTTSVSSGLDLGPCSPSTSFDGLVLRHKCVLLSVPAPTDLHGPSRVYNARFPHETGDRTFVAYVSSPQLANGSTSFISKGGRQGSDVRGVPLRSAVPNTVQFRKEHLNQKCTYLPKLELCRNRNQKAAF
jgi:hypothetical protein